MVNIKDIRKFNKAVHSEVGRKEEVNNFRINSDEIVCFAIAF